MPLTVGVLLNKQASLKYRMLLIRSWKSLQQAVSLTTSQIHVADIQ